MNTSDPVESFLDELLTAARALPVRDARYLLAETEAHLRDAVDAALQRGLSQHDAEMAALADFGTVTDLVGRERTRMRTPLRALAGQATRTAFVLGAIGAIAVGISGVIAGFLYWIGGASAIAPVPHASDLKASNCARWIGLTPGSGCRAAAISDWADETVVYRIALGVLGGVALVLYALATRRRGTKPGLAPIVTDSIATTLFVLAAVGTLALGINALVTSPGSGAGQWVSAAPVALVASAVFGSRVARRLREQAFAL
jgi:hypothetical protein